MFNRLLQLLALSPLIGIGCASISKPEVRDIRVAVTAIDLQSVALACDVDIYNPYPFTLATPEFEYGFEVEDYELMKSAMATKLDLPARNVGTVKLPLRIEYLQIWKARQALTDSPEINYRLHGTVLVNMLDAPLRLPVSHSGTFPVLRLPKISTPKLRTPEVSLTRAKVAIDTQMTNPNVFRIGLKQLGLTVSIGDVQVGGIGLVTPEAIEAKGSGNLTITGEITARTMLGQLATGKEIGTPSMRLVGAIETPFGVVDIGK